MVQELILTEHNVFFVDGLKSDFMAITKGVPEVTVLVRCLPFLLAKCQVPSLC